jgi:hypothetical protein
MRRLDAIGLSACAVALGGSSALAAAPGFETDPSVDGGAFAWQVPGGPGMLRTSSSTIALPGTLPALGGANVAWLAGREIVVTKDLPVAPPQTIPVPALASVDALAVSAGWLVVRDESAGGIANLFAVSLQDPARRRYLAGSGIAGAIGRPALAGSTVAYAYSNAQGSTIYAVDLDSGARRVLRGATRNVLFENPALLGGRLLYERVGRCAQQLLLGSASSPSVDRVVFSLPSTVFRDSGYQPGYTHAFNHASLCGNRRSGGGATTTLGATALSAAHAYVSESPTDVAHTLIFTIALG